MNRKKQTTAWTNSVCLFQFIMFGVMAIAIYSLMMTDANAANPGATLCKAIGDTMGGGLARAISTIGILIVGVGATLGKMTWTTALTVAVGIAVIFGTLSIVSSLSGVGAPGCFGT
jgi:type IV secretory pathway VirB2 component (pilin)